MSGTRAPEAAASVSTQDWPHPPPSRAASQDRASVPPPVRMETALSRGSAAAPGPSAARPGPKSGPPAATVAWRSLSPSPAPPSFLRLWLRHDSAPAATSAVAVPCASSAGRAALCFSYGCSSSSALCIQGGKPLPDGAFLS